MIKYKLKVMKLLRSGIKKEGKKNRKIGWRENETIPIQIDGKETQRERKRKERNRQIEREKQRERERECVYGERG